MISRPGDVCHVIPSVITFGGSSFNCAFMTSNVLTLDICDRHPGEGASVNSNYWLFETDKVNCCCNFVKKERQITQIFTGQWWHSVGLWLLEEC